MRAKVDAVQTRGSRNKSYPRVCSGPLHLFTHCRECSHEPVLADMVVLERDRRQLNRKIVEAFQATGKTFVTVITIKIGCACSF